MDKPRDPDCLFCKIVSGEVLARKVLQTTDVTAFEDINPQAATHLLVIPNAHTASLAETDDPALLAAVLASVRDLAKERGLKDYRVVINNGHGAGQTVFHLHVHLLGGRIFGWPPG